MRANQANITLLDLQKSFAAQDKVFHQGRSSDSLGSDAESQYEIRAPPG